MLPIIAAMFGDLGDVEHPENQNEDFRDGYAEGLTSESHTLADRNNPITVEWRKRKEPQREDRSFRTWKRGYWVGRIERVSAIPR